MKKSKMLKSIVFVTGLTFIIALLLDSHSSIGFVPEKLLDSHTSIGFVSENEQLQKSSQSINLPIKYSDEKRTLLIEQYHKEQLTASRGAGEREPKASASPTQNQSVPPTEVKSAAPTEAKSETPTETKPGAPSEVKPAASTESGSVASIEVEPVAPAKTEPVAPATAEPATSAKSAPSAPTEAAPAVPTNELDLLARLITAEAQGEPYETKVAVGAVVMNRVESGSWPNTIKEVIYQNINGYYQFTPVVNGWINKPAESGSIEAAKAALSGADPTNGAQFYYDDTTTNPWILAKPVSVKIGHMTFAF